MPKPFEIGTEALVSLIDGRPRVRIGMITDIGFDLIRGEDYIRVDDGERLFASDIFGIRPLADVGR